MRNIFKSLTTPRITQVQDEHIHVICEDGKDREFLILEIQEFAYRKDILVNFTVSDVDNSLYIEYSL